MSDKFLGQGFTPLAPDEIEPALREAANLHASSMLWQKESPDRVQTSIYLYVPRTQVICFRPPTGAAAIALNTLLSDPKTKAAEFCFSITTPKALYFFKSTLANLNKGHLEFRIPTVVFKIQRRKNLRLPPAALSVNYVEFKHPHLADSTLVRRLFDVSSGGLSFLISEEEKGLFPAKSLLHNLKIFLDQDYLISSAQIAHSQILSKNRLDERIKVGVEFQGLSLEDQQLIETFVIEETRRHYAQLFG